jgi:hypothetical protein
MNNKKKSKVFGNESNTLTRTHAETPTHFDTKKKETNRNHNARSFSLFLMCVRCFSCAFFDVLMLCFHDST